MKLRDANNINWLCRVRRQVAYLASLTDVKLRYEAERSKSNWARGTVGWRKKQNSMCMWWRPGKGTCEVERCVG